MKKKFYQSLVCKSLPARAGTIAALLFITAFNAVAQEGRNYSLVFSDNIRGGSAMFGNTLMALVNPDNSVNVAAMNDNSANGNSNFSNGNSQGTAIMQNVDIDGSTGDGAVTRNSSSSDLVLPAGTNTIKVARLYWGGRTFTASRSIHNPANQNIRIRKGTSGPYQQLGAVQIDKYYQNQGLPNEVVFYQAYTDITSLIQQNGEGTYTVGDATLSTGNGGVFGNYGGWTIVVVYENPSLEYNSIRVYDGYQRVFNGGSPTTASVTLTGLDVPSGALSLDDARMGVMTWEGDANFIDDYLEINGNRFSNAMNQINNPWNGTITNDGVHVTTKNPNYTNQMGVDIDQFNVGTGYGILPNATNVTLKFGTELDQYFPGVFSFVIRMKDPQISLSKTVADTDGDNVAKAGDTLVYVLKGKNLGVGDATSVLVTDTLPGTVTYISGSLKANYGPGLTAGTITDAAGDDAGEYFSGASNGLTIRVGNGADAVNAGTLASLDSFEIEFMVRVNQPASGESLPAIVNTARMSANSESLVPFFDDATAVINSDGGPLPVTLKSFSAVLAGSKSVKLNWITSMELNSKKFEIERSADGRKFTAVAFANAAGNSSIEKAYSVTDDISSLLAGNIVYYRLKQVDLDGKSAYSQVVAVRLAKSAGGFTVAPNPFRDFANVTIDWNRNEAASLRVVNMNGREVVVKNLRLIKGTNYVPVNEMNSLPKGSYIIQFISAEGMLVKQVLKQ